MGFVISTAGTGPAVLRAPPERASGHPGRTLGILDKAAAAGKLDLPCSCSMCKPLASQARAVAQLGVSICQDSSHQSSDVSQPAGTEW